MLELSFTAVTLHSKSLVKRNDDWFCMCARHGEEHIEHETLITSGKHASPTRPWKLDFMVWLIALDTVFQIGMGTDRPTWRTGLISYCTGVGYQHD
jgi:hypothetical protein